MIIPFSPTGIIVPGNAYLCSEVSRVEKGRLSQQEVLYIAGPTEPTHTSERYRDGVRCSTVAVVVNHRYPLYSPHPVTQKRSRLLCRSYIADEGFICSNRSRSSDGDLIWSICDLSDVCNVLLSPICATAPTSEKSMKLTMRNEKRQERSAMRSLSEIGSDEVSYSWLSPDRILFSSLRRNTHNRV